jgi:DNA polymerase III sliding clamp (beta) subunit (PCNA family)
MTLNSLALASGLKAISKLRSGGVKSAVIEAVGKVRFHEPDGVSFSRALESVVSGEVPPGFGFNSEYLADILKTHPAAGVTFHFSDTSGSQPILIKFDNDDDFLAVLMPMRA